MRVPVIVEEKDGRSRAVEPIAFGLPLAKGELRALDRAALLDESGAPLPVQLEPLAWWSDSSVKWVLLEALVDAEAGGRRELTLTDDATAAAEAELTIDEAWDRIRIKTGVVEALIPRRGHRLLDGLRLSSGAVLDEERGVRVQLEDQRVARHELRLTAANVTARGPVRAEVTLRGRLGPTLEVAARVSLWARRGLLRVDLTVHNPRPAQHRGGTWDLGDPGSVVFRDLSVRASRARAPRSFSYSLDGAGELIESAGPWVEIYQDSSGGERWDAPTHLDRDLRVPHSFRGYRVRSTAEPGRRGDRATPSLWLVGPEASLGAAVRDFWQSFPTALEASGAELIARLFPEQFAGLHELQGGEQKTHSLWLSAETPQNLGWTQQPLVARTSPAQAVSSGALPHLIEWDRDREEALKELASVVIDPEQGLAARREVIDEYGWRNFGDAWADHENVGNDQAAPRISHYNNQYDGIHSMLVHFLRSGDSRWLQLGDEMARHAADIDIYRTEGDRSAFSGGMFWHTDHYSDAVTSTHRCYTRHHPLAQAGSYGGGPAAEHDYGSGLALHALMTGWTPSREAALSLAEWVIAVDEPEDTLAGRLLPGPSGLASRTDDHSYHGPGRGAGNSIETLLDGLLLTDDERYLRKAEELIRRVVHPDDDRDAFGLVTEPETRWSYIVLLLAVIRYLEVKSERGEIDDRYAYAQATLVAYARWMMEHEGLSSEKKDLLEIWTESWPAQDLRKGLILAEAARHVDNSAEAEALRSRGADLFAAARDELLEWATRTLTRPLFLVMRYGYLGAAILGGGDEAPMPRGPEVDLGSPSGFVPWKGKPKAWIRRLKRCLGR